MKATILFVSAMMGLLCHLRVYSAENVPACKASQLLPFLRTYDLKGLADSVHLQQRSTNVHYPSEVALDSSGSFDEMIPFRKLFLYADHLEFSIPDQGLYVFCPFPAPSLDQLTSARTYREILAALAPSDRSEHQHIVDAMQVAIAEQTLKDLSGPVALHLRAIYFHENRLLWVNCYVSYTDSIPRSLDTAFNQSTVTVTASPIYP